MVDGLAPFPYRHCPPLSDVLQGPVQELQGGLVGREGTVDLGHSPQTHVQGFDSVGRVDDLPDFGGVPQVVGELVPVGIPGPVDEGVLLFPVFAEILEGLPGYRFGGSFVDRLEVLSDDLAVFEGDQLGGNLRVVEVSDVFGYLPGRHPLGVHRQNLFIEDVEVGLVLGDELGIKVAVAVPRHFNPQVALGGF